MAALLFAFFAPHLGLASDAPISWGKPVGGLVIGVSIQSQPLDRQSPPILNLFLANQGTNEIEGIIQSADRCVVAVNAEYYANQDHGGKTSYMPPSRRYGPIQIDLARLHQIPTLTPPMELLIESSAPHPKLRAGTNIISVYYVFGYVFGHTQFAQSGEIAIKAP